ncbi:dCTP deaminase [Sphaerobacter thermophilus]|jgi:dCTP deaminase|uniref:dCTP deaminase n=1 Tax=Sphaerobacter thermophilus (strain ATCC 49802 / DSM 20745 / KCCM 41009 / NCIMB 13125 / S 6022) TaxID=479434 RepID=D1C775_SPHTD|nr:dCTP deaminase [Sphaerobacter thermophilus]ACZ39721.1 deoxycytidine triphosphate deaminase [Sphaerobacter thermophilus DSM 20745]
MILSDRDIVQALESGRIKITPQPDLERSLGSCSIDFRLGNTFMVFEHSRFSYIDPRQPQSIGDAMRTITVPDGEAFIMQAGDFALASTLESLELPDDLLGRLEGRSSIARLGITVHSTAAVFEPGWVGTATMELSNLGRMAVALYPGMRICSFTFEQLTSPAMVPYRKKRGNKYAGQIDPKPSRLAEEIAMALEEEK